LTWLVPSTGLEEQRMAKGRLTEGTIMRALNWAYDTALGGLPGFASATELGDEYAQGEGSLADRANALIRWQVARASASGFVTGLGGVLVMPITLPSDLLVVSYLQLRMIAALAHIGGHDVHEDKVRTLAFVCLCGDASKDVLKGVGIRAGEKLAERLVKTISGETIAAINKAVGFRLLTKFGEKGIVNLGKAIPIVGGTVSAVFDGVATKTVGNVARDVFIPA
jgi:uncharacterized protein (DUF697 family)